MARWGRLLLVLALLAPAEAAKPMRAVTLAWTTTASLVTAWELEQCTLRGQTCGMAPAASFGPATAGWMVTGLDLNKTYCWRVRPMAGGTPYEWSNTVCD